jgi:hypothetical protein
MRESSRFLLTADRSTTELRWNFFCGSRGPEFCAAESARQVIWLRGRDLNPRPSGYEPDELPGCSTPRLKNEYAESPVKFKREK